MALLMMTTEMSCQRTERSVKSSQGRLGLMPLVSACSCRISSSSPLWTSQPLRRLRAEQQEKKKKRVWPEDWSILYNSKLLKTEYFFSHVLYNIFHYFCVCSSLKPSLCRDKAFYLSLFSYLTFSNCRFEKCDLNQGFSNVSTSDQ